VRHNALDQLDECPIAEGKKHRIDIGLFESCAKGDIEQERRKKIGDKVGCLIPPLPQVHPCAGDKGKDGQQDHPSNKKNVKLP